MSDRFAEVMRVTAAKAAANPAYMGWVLAVYQSTERLTNADLGSLLGTQETALQRLAICLRPRESDFASDVRALAKKLSLDPGTLAKIVRHADAVAAMREPTNSAEGTGQLLAARFKTGTPRHLSDRDQQDSKSDGGSK